MVPDAEGSESSVLSENLLRKYLRKTIKMQTLDYGKYLLNKRKSSNHTIVTRNVSSKMATQNVA